MSENQYKNKPQNLNENEVDFVGLVTILWLSKYTIIAITSIFIICGVLISLSIPDRYTASVLLKMSEDSSSASSQYSGLASMAGISLSGPGDKTAYAVATIESKGFLKHLVSFKGVKENLYAAESYDKRANKISYKKDTFDDVSKKWLSSEPSYIKVHTRSVKRKLIVKEDKNTKFIKIEYEHVSPYFARDFLELVIRELNNVSRKKDLVESSDALEYLYNHLEKTKQKDFRESMNKIIKNQLETQMLANVREDYLVTPVDPVFIPEFKSHPSRSIICIVAALLGGLLSILLVLIRRSNFFSDVKKRINL